MERHEFGNTKLVVSILGLGTADIGFRHVDDRTVDALLGCASDAGINVIDTAAMYASAEELLGRGLRHRRRDFFVFTKCGRHLPRLPTLARMVRRVRRSISGMLREPPVEWHPKTLERTIEQSLRRLDMDVIDLIQLHSCSEELLRRGDAIRALQRARSAGKVRFLGYSGDGSAARWAIESGHFDAVQLSINVADQQALDDILPRALARGLGVIAKRPLANAVWTSHTRPENENLHAYWDRLRTLDYDFMHGEDAIATALRFTLATGVHTAIIGTTSPRNMLSNVQAAHSALHRSEYEGIRARWIRTARPEWVGQT